MKLWTILGATLSSLVVGGASAGITYAVMKNQQDTHKPYKYIMKISVRDELRQDGEKVYITKIFDANFYDLNCKLLSSVIGFRTYDELALFLSSYQEFNKLIENGEIIVKFN